ncbi:MAG TPA: acyl-CoA dehydrogenase family protein [Polyangiales bacterium]|nr:acyl-CoA dehydrogenase family protein [Polyangiales bacterium]
MQLVPNESQTLLKQNAHALFRERARVGRLRVLRDDKDPVGFSRELWREMAALGWVGLALPEQYEGLGLGMSDLCVVLEEAGRQLAPEPWISTVLLGAQALVLGGDAEQNKQWLPRIACGEAVLALAYEEPLTHLDLARISTRAVRTGGALRLHGEKLQVLDGHVADALLVFARVDEGHTLFLVDPKARGVTIQRQTRVDGRNAALIRFEDVAVGAQAMVGQGGRGLELLTRVIDRATVGLCAEMLGGASQAYEDTVEYLKTRKQFGVTLGSFQALAHRAARLYIELALARSAVAAAASCADEGTPAELAKLASLAKARCSEAFVHVASEAIQMHGGIGVTDDFHIGFYFKRARAADVQFGDATHHLRRWAALSGY